MGRQCPGGLQQVRRESDNCDSRALYHDALNFAGDLRHHTTPNHMVNDRGVESISQAGNSDFAPKAGRLREITEAHQDFGAPQLFHEQP